MFADKEKTDGDLDAVVRFSQDVHQPAEDPSPATPDDMPSGNAESVLDAHRSTAAEEGASHPVEQLVSDARPHNETPVQPMMSPGESLNNLPRVREREREFYSQLHCRHIRRAISPSKLVPILSNAYIHIINDIQRKTQLK